MKGKMYAAVAHYLSDIAEEISPASLESYVAEVRGLVPGAAMKQLQSACRQQAKACDYVQKAIRHLSHGVNSAARRYFE